MSKVKLSRREFMQAGAITAAGLAMSQFLHNQSPAKAIGATLSTPLPPVRPTPTAYPVTMPWLPESTLPPNPLLKKMGFSEKDRVLIVHVDDLGMCQSNVEAFADLTNFGLVSSGSVMMPCAWAPLAAHFARTHPNADMGVHLTLTSEWEANRWRPISTVDPASGLIDADGYMWRDGTATSSRATPEAGLAEMEAQIKRAMEMGIDITHADSHQFLVLYPTFSEGYHQLILKYRLPSILQRKDEAGWRVTYPGYPDSIYQYLEQGTLAEEEQGIPHVDNAYMIPMEQPEYKMSITKQAIDALTPGINVLIIHCTKDSPELRAITPDWFGRVADYNVWMSEEMRDHIKKSGITIVGFRAVRDALRS